MNLVLSLLLILSGCFVFSYHRLLRYLRFYQQEEYSSLRFLRWGWRNRAYDRKGTAVVCAAAIAYPWINAPLSLAAASALALAIVAWNEEEPRRRGKLTLKMTERATRLFRLAMGIETLFILTWTIGTYSKGLTWVWVGAALAFQGIPFTLIIANLLLWTGERRRQACYRHEAQAILKAVSPVVIGITGSYGKTSTKEALGHILQVTLGPTFWPPKSINTPMGITKEIRTKLRQGMSYAIVEMGAYRRGSIRRLCGLTPPHAGIITGIGSAHLERFGSLENILLAKSELAQAIPPDGILVCNGDCIGSRRIAKEYPKKTTLLYGFEPALGPLDCWVKKWHVTAKGTEFTLCWQNRTYEAFTPLLGRPALSNCVAAFTMACALGSQPDYALAVIHTLAPVDNRLQLDNRGAVTYLRDAYNSNPSGFSAALDVLHGLPGSRKWVMTPGMIELGPIQQEENEKVGRMAARVCDIAIIVGPTNRQALLKGLLQGGMKAEQVLLCDHRDQAFERLASLQREGDVILLENDLSDLYEAKERF